MASLQNFRSAFHGFNREDVVHYIQYLNNKYNNSIHQLQSENQTLTEELEALRAKPDLSAEYEQLQAEKAAMQAQLDELTAQVETLQAQVENAAQPAALSDEELEAYRRAEKAERTAKERARQIYCQATGALADATAQVDDAAEHFAILSQRITSQLSELQATVAHSKDALQGAAATLYAIVPAENEEQ